MAGLGEVCRRVHPRTHRPAHSGRRGRIHIPIGLGHKPRRAHREKDQIALASVDDALTHPGRDDHDGTRHDGLRRAVADLGQTLALLDEVATGKISGEEDWWSGTDLYDFAANVEGSKMAFSLVRDFALSSGPDGEELVALIDDGYAQLEAELAEFGSLSDGFVSYGTLTEADKRTLSDQINTLAEPLSQLTVTVLE